MFNTWFLISFAATVVSASFWPVMPHWVWAPLMLLLLLASTKYSVFRSARGSVTALLLVICLGNAIEIQTSRLFQSGQNTTINASVVSLFSENSHGFESVIVARSIGGEKLIFPQLIKLRLFTPFKLTLGDDVYLSVSIKPVWGKLNEAGFDQEKYLFSTGVVANATYRPDTQYRIHSSTNLRSRWFETSLERLSLLANQDLIVALSFGYRDLIPPQRWDLLKSSGLIHLMAISGLHIGIAFGIGYQVGKICRLLSPSFLWFPTMFGLGLAYFYSWFAGFTLPTLRALVMCVLASYFLWRGQNVNLLRYVALSLCVVLLIWPFSALSSSFWLSFGALGAVLYIALNTQRSASTSTFFDHALKLIKIQLMLTFLIAPFSMLFFKGISLVSVFYNLLLLPWVSVVTISLLFLAMFISLISESVSGVVSLIELENSLVSQLWKLVDLSLEPLVFSLPFSERFWIQVDNQTIALSVFLILFLSFVSRYFKKTVSILVIVVFVLWWEFGKPQQDKLTIDILDVGHGLSLVLEKNSQIVIYDLGNAWPGGSVVESLLIPTLNQRGIHELEGVIVSHFDSDHAGGYPVLLESYDPKWIRTSQNRNQQPQSQSKLQACIIGENWSWQDIVFEVLWPPKQVKRAYNPHSCVVKISDPSTDFSMLLTGDIELVSEWLLARDGEQLRSDVMLVPHHGSDSSSIKPFIEAVSPQLAIASLAKGNQWGMPSESVVERYQDAGSTWLDTGESGQITITLSEEGWQYHAIREQQGGQWYRQMLRKGVE
ncbi:DNA internalization-related competence protein ComEC/Rec2 [Vibrio sp. 10N.261.46.E12]|uniref:DNA internalization-related competence protein ComEC/Rec2 n=1 Tax=unclassified Vibrio TaxID=2614977 RepID=UPI000977F0F0|nr:MULTISPECIES: DNA internalization-related competence protein ComEC/Rec2 [unclassified Vibrio]OMO38112.1 DNA internalization-related competence protein ComEC/Rec2 [Vibrio sp. 10N.261.45.E1]PMJ27474.1 DNA internalization-related competence protein ComEC/Rec2 [Vibrio sp. 10N.286.45.B6]PML89900.1 DNA internalization-related competence protein ComEC/Rec2 [Vibrio sp. 10N.261.49.E11]PMM64738.1 DNA internalization-related competence protein ComEC/Rec2 [Vibrio sp. 10N.261.46.F12]PMM84449.1 DNA inter